MPTLAELVAAQKAKAASQTAASAAPASLGELEKNNVNPVPQSNSLAGGIKLALGGITKNSEGTREVKSIEPVKAIKLNFLGNKVEQNPQQVSSPLVAVGTTGPGEPEDEVLPASSSGDTVLSGGAELKEFNHSQMTEIMMPVDEETFRAAIGILHGVFDNPEIVMNATKNILRSLRDNPQFNNFLVPDDIGMMVRALRNSYGLVASSKTVSKEKRKTKQDSIDAVADEIGALLK